MTFDRMRRREFITLLGGAAAAWPLAARGQQPTMPVVGDLHSTTPEGFSDYLRALRQGLKESGYVEGENVAIEYRWAENQIDRLPALAADLVQRRVALIVAVAPPAALAAKAATTTIPIVITRVADPVGSGLVPSLARPGGNVTGLSILPEGLAPKRIQLLTEILPGLSRVVVLYNADNPGNRFGIAEMEAASSQRGLQFLRLPVRNPSDFTAAFQAATRARAEALLVSDDVWLSQRRDHILKLAAAHSLPVVSGYRDFAEAGGLLAYGPNLPAVYRRAAHYVDRILKSAKASDLPLEQPTEFDLVINLKTARALGLTIPPSVLLSANHVIE